MVQDGVLAVAEALDTRGGSVEDDEAPTRPSSMSIVLACVMGRSKGPDAVSAGS